MPEPLSRIKPNAAVQFFPECLDSEYNEPELAVAVAGIISRWAVIEHELSMLLVHILGADATPALSMFKALQSQNVRFLALKSAAEAALTPTQFETFSAVTKVTDIVQKARNKLAHGLWGISPDLPKNLLVLDPRVRRDKETSILRAEEIRNMLAKHEKITNINKEERESIYVYKIDDLKKINEELDEALTTVNLFRIHLILQKKKPQISEVALHQLTTLRLFREALAQIRKSQKKTKQSQT